MSVEKQFAGPVHAVLKMALPVAVTLWLAIIAVPSLADDGHALDALYPDRTAGYVESALGLEKDEVEFADVAALASSSRPSADDWEASRRLRLAPVSTDPSDRIDRVMETYYPTPEFRLSVGSGGTIGFAIDF